MLRTKGEPSNFRVVGTTTARGGRTQTLLRFDLERGTEFWLLLWQDGKLRGRDVDVAGPGSTRFLPVSATDFASLDILSGRMTRIRFRKDAGGGISAVLSHSGSGEVEARKVQ